MSGLFVTLEGGEAAGKTTQAAALESWLRQAGHEVVRTREPGGTPLGTEVRALVLHREGVVAPRAEALLYAADRAQHVAEVVRPALERGAVVLQDRYLDSSVAYQGAGRVLDPGEVRRLSLWAVDGLLPDLTLLLDVDPAVGRERRSGPRDWDRLEAEQEDFHRRVREGYLRLAADEPQRFAVVDAALPVEEVQRRLRSALAPLLVGAR